MSKLTQKDFNEYANKAADKLFNRVFLILNEPLHTDVRAFLGLTWLETHNTLIMTLTEEIAYLKSVSKNPRFSVEKMHDALDTRVIHIHAEYTQHMQMIAANAGDADLLNEASQAVADARKAKDLTRNIIDDAIKAVR